MYENTMGVAFKNILVPYDGSTNSLNAFKVAVDIAQKYESKITILTCLKKPAYRGMWYQDSRSVNAIMKKDEKAAKENISKMVEPVREKTGIPVAFKIIPVVSAPDSITSFAKSHKIDLVVMGSHGRTGFNKALLGSVSQGVSQKIHCPVMITK